MPVADKYSNQAVITVTETAANTLTFKKLETGVSLFEKVAWLISRIEYWTSGYPQMNGSTDNLIMALTTTNQLTTIDITNAVVLDLMQVFRYDIGTAATGWFQQMPLIKDLIGLAGGGIIVPPNPLYGAIVGSGLAAATTANIKLYYTTIELKPEEYWELVEARRIISS